MEKTTFSLLFYIRKPRLNKHGEVPILFRLTINGVRADAHTHRFINPKLWNTAKGKAVESGKGCKELNYYFDAIQARILRTRLDMELEGVVVTAQSVLNRYLGKDTPERHTLVELFSAHNEKCRAGISISQ